MPVFKKTDVAGSASDVQIRHNASAADMVREILEADDMEKAFFAQWVLREAYIKWTAAKVTTSKTEPLKVETSKEDTAYDALYEKRLNRYYNDLKWLYCELFRDHPEVAGRISL